MPTQDLRGVLLRAFDRNAVNMIELGDSSEPDIAALWDLAHAIADSLITWQSIVDRLQTPVGRQLLSPGTGSLLVETVFEDLLDGPACRVLISALAIVSEPA